MVLGCGIGIELPTQAVYACSKNLNIQNTFGTSRYHEVGEELLTAEVVNCHL